MLDGAARVADLFSGCEQMGMPAIAITDHGNTFGAYELLAGRTPRTAESLTQFLLRGEEQPIPELRELAPEVPEALEDVVMRCLARIPEYRPSSAGALAAALTGTSGELPTAALGPDDGAAEAPTRVATAGRTRVAPAPETPVPETMVRSVARRPWRIALVIGAVALALALVGWMVFTEDSDPGSPAPAPAEVQQSPAEQASDFSEWLLENSEP